MTKHPSHEGYSFFAMREKILLEMIESTYQKSMSLFRFCEEMNNLFEQGVQKPEDPVIIVLWAQRGKYEPTEFTKTFGEEVIAAADPCLSRFFNFDDGCVLVEVAPDTRKAVERICALVTAGIDASWGWCEAYWGIIAYQK